MEIKNAKRFIYVWLLYILFKEKINMKLFDTHAHYNDEAFDEDREDIIKKIKQDNISTVVFGYDIEHSKKAIDLAKEYDFIYAGVRNSSKRYSSF